MTAKDVRTFRRLSRRLTWTLGTALLGVALVNLVAGNFGVSLCCSISAAWALASW